MPAVLEVRGKVQYSIERNLSVAFYGNNGLASALNLQIQKIGETQGAET